jgi:FLYWCH zinc finger domain
MISGRTKPLEFEDFEFKEVIPGKGPPPKGSHRKERGQQCSSTSFTVPFQFVESGRRNQVMICEGRKYIQNNKYGEKIYWKCSKWHDGCKARAITLQSQPDCIIRRNEHNHIEKINERDDTKVTV